MKNRSRLLIGLITGVILALIVVGVFFIGVMVGAKRENRLFPFWEKRNIFHDYVPNKLDGHGVAGVVDSIGSNTLVVKDRTGALKTILVDNETKIRRNRLSTSFSDLKVDENVIVLGNPEEKEGAIKAKIIRVIDGFIKESTSSER